LTDFAELSPPDVDNCVRKFAHCGTPAGRCAKQAPDRACRNIVFPLPIKRL